MKILGIKLNIRVMSIIAMIAVSLLCTRSVFADVSTKSNTNVEISEKSTDSNIKPLIYVTHSKASSSYITLDEYTDQMEKAYKDVKYPEVCNLPTLFRQNTFHPYPEDKFGEGTDSYPIFRVAVDSDDEIRKNKIAISFDSAYINNFTFRILDILDKYHATATFFMTNEFMEKNMEHVEEIISRGHEIGNHSTTHPDFNTVSDFDVIREVMKCHNFLQYKLGVDMCLFRFPYGSFSPRTVLLLKNMGYYPIQWSFDSIDWKNISLEYLIDRFITNQGNYMRDGSIILFHNGATYTPDFLPFFFEMLEANGKQAVKVSDLIHRHDFHIRYGTQISNFSKATYNNIPKLSTVSDIGY